MTNAGKSAPKTNRPEGFDRGGMYEIQIEELLEDHWQQWFEGMTLIRVQDEKAKKAFTLLRGSIPDQPALHGLLARIRDLNLTLISVCQIDPKTGRRNRDAPRNRS